MIYLKLKFLHFLIFDIKKINLLMMLINLKRYYQMRVIINMYYEVLKMIIQIYDNYMSR